ncbi:MAG: DUF4174 domain-containing protein [Pseudomonadota bacterium]
MSLIGFLVLSGAETDLASHRWELRPILVFSAEDDPRLAEQLERFEANRRDLEERRNIVIVETEPDSRLWQTFQPADFTVVLIGLDGGEKFRANRLVDPEELDELIDQMPMRRQELNQRD